MTSELAKVTLGSIEPSARALKKFERTLRWVGWATRLVTRPWVQEVEVRGREHLAKGPLLVLMNHTNVLDPFLLTVHGQRPIQFLITEAAMSAGIGSRFASWWGQVPKRKLDNDTRSMRTLKKWVQMGGAVGLFPEGQFTWDGHPLPIRTGLAQLVSYLDVPVVTARLINGDRLWPSWAKHRRRTKLRLEIDPPRKFERGEPVEAIVADRLRVDPDTCDRWPVSGKRLAEGLAQLLRYCPSCGADDTLLEAGNRLSCTTCERNWEVTGENRLEGKDDAMTIASALRRAESHWREQWLRTKSWRSRGEVTVLDVGRGASSQIARGILRLEEGHLRMDGWELATNDVLAHMLDWGERIVIRTERSRLAFALPEDSRALWTVAFDETMRRAKSE